MIHKIIRTFNWNMIDYHIEKSGQQWEPKKIKYKRVF